MKNLFFILALFFITGIYAQVGVGTSSPAPSAVLEVKSSSKGFLPPRLTTEQIKGIPSPEAGLMVYNLNTNKPCYFNGTQWMYYDTTHVLPELGKYWEEGGGVVVYLDAAGLHGYVATPSTDQSTGTIYGCYGTNIPGAQFTAVGTGQSNTTAILAVCGTAGIAARLCDDLVLNGRSDWFLPSKDELSLVFQQKASLTGVGGGYYISSSQISATQVWMVDFGTGVPLVLPPSSNRYVRAIRAF